MKGTAALAVGVFSGVMTASQLGIGFLGLRVKMQTLAVLSSGVGVAGFSMLLVAERHPQLLAIIFLYSLLLGTGFGIQSIAIGNLFPDYFGRSEFPKIMGYTMPFTTVVSSFGATVAGVIRDTTGAYTLAFQFALGAMILGFICILFARPPVHRLLKTGTYAGIPDAAMTPETAVRD